MALGQRIVSPCHRHVTVAGVVLTSSIETPCGTSALDTTEVAHEIWVPASSELGCESPSEPGLFWLLGAGQLVRSVRRCVRGTRKVFTASALGARLPTR